MLKMNVISDAECERVSDCFGTLSDATRLKIFCLLCHSELCVMNIAELIGMSSPAVAHHLRLLKSAGLILNKRKGREMYYKLSDSAEAGEIHKAMDALLHVTCAKSQNT